jgi:hypothetical protein
VILIRQKFSNQDAPAENYKNLTGNQGEQQLKIVAQFFHVL